MSSQFDKIRREHPRPDFVRSDWIDLNGQWDFDFDPANLVDGDGQFLRRGFSRTITVPFPYQSAASGIGQDAFSPCIWYRRTFDLPPGWTAKRAFLNFGAVDGDCTVWLNDVLVGTHSGGYDSFSFEISTAAKAVGNELVVKVLDDLDASRPRGKQAWASPFAVWYSQMSGIWQSVWLEVGGDLTIERLTVEHVDPVTGALALNVATNRPSSEAELEVTLHGNRPVRKSFPLRFPLTRCHLEVPEVRPWSPESPVIYDLTVRVTAAGEVSDEVITYVAFRTVEVRERSVLINGRETFLRLVLDQGYWPESLYTPPSFEALEHDIRSAQEMGFNGCRKHIKAEDPRMLYLADRLGYFVWSEMPSNYAFTDKGRRMVVEGWARIVERDRNHPSVIGWLLYNESWGAPRLAENGEERDWIRFLVRLTKQLDPSRFVVDNDGWEHVAPDLLTYHTYAPDGESLRRDHEAYLAGGAPTGRSLMAAAPVPLGLPVFLSEFGGVGRRIGAANGGDWGYGELSATENEYLERLSGLFQSAYEIDGLAGFCYTQLYDVESEINGLLDSNRVPKAAVQVIRRIVLNLGE